MTTTIPQRLPLDKIHGIMTALVTPMKNNGAIDWDAYRQLIERQIINGVHGLVVVGTTGESPTVDFEEHHQLIAVAVEQAQKRIPIIAGTGANSTLEAIELTQFAASVGADACLSVVPYYNKPTQAGLKAHFESIANSSDLPIILYNVPGRTITDMSNDTIIELAQHQNIIGIKDATGDLERGADLLKRCPSDFKIFSGDDATAVSLMNFGAHGNISVTSNIFPKEMAEIYHLLKGINVVKDIEKAKEIDTSIASLHQDLFVQANPIPVKWLLHRMGLIDLGIRLPLLPLEQEFQDMLWNAYEKACVK
jgi:4-hydroxy-tetrahydrodipicolinate synthase